MWVGDYLRQWASAENQVLSAEDEERVPVEPYFSQVLPSSDPPHVAQWATAPHLVEWRPCDGSRAGGPLPHARGGCLPLRRKCAELTALG